MPSVHRPNDDLFVLDLLTQAILEVKARLRFQHLRKTVEVYSDMVHLDKDVSSIVLYGNESALHGDHLIVEIVLTNAHEVSGVVERVETKEVAAEHTFNDLVSVLRAYKDVGARERCVEVQTDVCFDILTLQVGGREDQVNIVDPDKVFLFLDLKQSFNERLVNIAKSMPELVLEDVKLDIDGIVVVKQGLQVLVDEDLEEDHDLTVDEDRDTIVLGKKGSDLALLRLVPWNDARPSYPLEVELVLKLKNHWIDRARRILDAK